MTSPHGAIRCLLVCTLTVGRGVGGPGSARGRKTLRTYINDEGEEVTEEVWEDGPAPLQQQQQPSTSPAAQTAAAVAGGHAKGNGAVAAKMAVKAPAAGGKMTKVSPQSRSEPFDPLGLALTRARDSLVWIGW